MSKFLITDKNNIKFHYDGWEVDEAHLHPIDSYSFVSDEHELGMKPIGRVYFDGFKNLNYTTGEPVERATISGGEKGVTKKYLRAGKAVYTSEQVKDLINSKLYEKSSDLKPRLPQDVYELLAEVSENKGKNKPNRAKEILKKYDRIHFDAEEVEQ